VMALLLAGPAQAATFCVAVEHAGCTSRPSAQQAFADARDGDRIELGRLTEGGALTDGGRALDVVGAGEDETRLTGTLTLADAGSGVTGASLGALDLAGTATRVRVEGAATLRGTARLRAAAAGAEVRAVSGAPRLEDVLVEPAAGPGLRAGCDSTLTARHVTVAGAADPAVDASCAGARVVLRDTVLAVGGAAFAGGERVATTFSAYPAVAGRAGGEGDRHDVPVLALGGRLPAGSALADAGSPDGLDADEWPEDRDGLPRAADGDGDGALRRDPGAFELPAPAGGLPDGNLLRDPGAEEEQGGGWALAGPFARERYGGFPFPSVAAAGALGGERAFFAGGPGPGGSAVQAVDVTPLAPEIDQGRATAALSALLGGYRADADAAVVEARFRDPAARELGLVALGGPSAAERANATTLLARARADGVPPLTRSIEVSLRAGLATGSYADAYFDNVALAVTAPGGATGQPPPGAIQRPFAGIRVLTGLATIDRRRRRITVRLACVDATVGRCQGVLTLAGVLRRGTPPVRIGSAGVDVGAGRTRRVHVRIARRAARAVKRRGRIAMTLFAAVRDGQPVTRATTVPLTLRWPGEGRKRRR